MTAASKRVEKAAINIASAGAVPTDSTGHEAPVDTVDITSDIVDLKAASQLYSANLAVVRTQDQMDKELYSRFDQTV